MSKHKLFTLHQHYRQLIVFLFALALWFIPTPQGLDTQAWHLFAIFISAILSVVINALPIFTASILALSVTVLSGLLTPQQAYSGFSQDFILLILVAFLIARGVIKSGLGKRIAFLIIKKFGHSSLGLSYSVVAADILIAPAFPSNTARSGVLFPIINALANDSHSKVADGTRKKIGSFLMMSSMAGLTLSSALWLSAMAANPTGIAIAKEFGVNISYGLWVAAAIVPIAVLFALIPYLLYKIYPPQIKHTPNAPLIADEALQHMGKVSKNEWIMLATFVVMIFLWVFSSQWHINKTAVAFLGLSILMINNIFTLDDMKNEGNALETLIWFGILYTLSVYLNKFGFMGWLGNHIAESISGFPPFTIYFVLVIGYVLIHYLFVSQTAHMLALFSVFLEVGIQGGVNPELLTLMLLFATNFNAIITPQGSSANVLYVGSGYVEPNEIYKIGGIVTLINSIVFLTIGTLWILQIT